MAVLLAALLTGVGAGALLWQDTASAAALAGPNGPDDQGGASTIGDLVWYDTNANGIYDFGETGINGVTVQLYLDDGDGVFEPGTDDQLVDTTVTGDDPSTPAVEEGWYEFSDVTFGGPIYWVNLPASNFAPGQPLDDFVLTSGNTLYPNPALVIEPQIIANRDDIDFGYTRPAIELQKTVYAGHNAGAGCPGSDSVSVSMGAAVTYCFVVRNTGGTYLNSIVITDAALGIPPNSVILRSGSQPLAPNAQLVFYYQTTVSASLLNTAVASGTPSEPDGTPIPGASSPSDDDTAQVTLVGPGIDIQKTVYLGHNNGASCPGGELASGLLGAQITYCFVVRNTGNTHLNNIQITDPQLGITQANMTILGSPSFPLAPNASVTYYYQTTITGDRVNTAAGTGTPTDSNGTPIPGATPPTDNDTAEVNQVAPGIQIQKTVYLGHNSGATCPGGSENVTGVQGAQVTFCFVVTNTGDTHLSSITINDANLGITQANMTLKSGSTPLAPGASLVYYYQTTVNGTLTNTAVASGNPTDQNGNDLPGLPNPSDDDTATVTRATPGVEIQKTVYLGHNSGASCPGVENVSGVSGAAVTYCFRVVNTGDTYLTTILITDTTLGITQANMTPLGNPNTPLPPGGSLTYYYQTTITNDLVNTAATSGTPSDPNGTPIPNAPPPTDTDTTQVDRVNPAVEMQKTVYLGHNSGASCPGSESVNGAVGAQITYCFAVVNTGDTYLTNITINDATLGITRANMTLRSGVEPLAPGQSLVFYYQTTLTGGITNTAVAGGTPSNPQGNPLPGVPPPTDDDTASTTTASPAIRMEKTVYLGHNSGASCPGLEQVASSVGAAITYCFRVVNIGGTYLNTILITDTILGITQANMTLLSGSQPLAPGASITYYYQTTLTGNITNTATTSGTPTDSGGTPIPGATPPTDGDTASTSTAQAGIEINKTAYLGHNSGASCPGAETVAGAAGAQITYCFVVTNTGNTFLASIRITDTLLGITQANMTLRSGSLPLAPGASLVYYYQTTITGDLTNTAQTTGTPTDQGGTPIPGVNPPTDTDTTNVDQVAPAIQVQKTVYLGHNAGASCPGADSLVGEMGDAVTYCFIVTNTGDTHVNNVVISDPALGITQANMTLKSGTQPLAPGASLVYYYQTTITGDLTNVATATGTPSNPNGTPIPGVTPPQDDDSSTVDQVSPGIQAQKTVYLGHNNGASCPGSDSVTGAANAQVTYCFQVINTGDTHLTNISIVDAPLGITQADMTLKSGSIPLAPGASLVYYYQATITGDLQNVAEATGTPSTPGGTPIPGIDPPSDDDTSTVEQISPGMNIDKTIYAGHNNGASCPGSESVTGAPGAAVTYCFVVTNTGDTHLTNILISDPNLSITQANMTLKSGTVPLAPGASLVYYYQTTVNGSLQNVATTTGTPSTPGGVTIPGATPPTDNDTASVTQLAVGSIGDLVWNDNNGNGIQDPGEPGLPGITVTLFDNNGSQVAQTTTNAQGVYIFSNVPAGVYTVGFTLPGAGYFFSPQNQGGDDTVDSDPKPNTGRTDPITLVGGQNITTVDAGIFAPPIFQITKTDFGFQAKPGDVVVYEIEYKNVGLTQATGVVLTETVPLHTVFYAAESSNGWSCPNASPAGTKCIYNVGTLAPGASGKVEFAVLIDIEIPTPISIRNIVVIGDDDTHGQDPNGPTPPAAEDTTPVDRPKVVGFRVPPAATPVDGGLLIDWTTSFEENSAGFHIYRSADGQWESRVQITDGLIPAVGGNVDTYYSYLDASAVPGVSYTYWLVETETTGNQIAYGPFTGLLSGAATKAIYLPVIVK